MSKMKTKQTKSRFWLVMGAVNTLALFYPINIYRGAGDGDAQLLAALFLVGTLFVLGLVDTVSVVFAYLL